MKAITIFILIVLTCITTNSYGQLARIKLKQGKIIIDTTYFSRQERFQNIVNDFQNEKYYIPEIENDPEHRILDTKFKALEFAKFIVKIKIGKRIDKYKKKFTISEDKEKNIWFVNCDILHGGFGGNVYMIIIKKNCKLLYYFETH